MWPFDQSDDLLHDKESTELFMARISGIPLILMSESECTTHVFQGIKLGAVDFLKRPLSELKLRVIWQHAVRKVGTSCFRWKENDFTCFLYCEIQNKVLLYS